MLKNEFNPGNPVWVLLGQWQKNVYQKQTSSAKPKAVSEPHLTDMDSSNCQVLVFWFSSLKKNLKLLISLYLSGSTGVWT